MKTKEQTFMSKVASALMLQAMLLLTVLTPMQGRALDIQTLPDTVAATSGFTHAARVTWDDLNAADASVVWVQLFQIPTNSYIDRVAYIVEEHFTNTTYVAADSTNVVLNIGVGGTTNAFFGSNTLVFARQTLSTNMLVPYRATTSTNYLVATFSEGKIDSQLDNYPAGKIRIYWRVVQPTKYRF